MKKSILLTFILVISLVLGVVSNASSPSTLVDFTTPDDFDAYVTALGAKDISYKNHMDQICTYEQMENFTRFTTTGTAELWTSVPMDFDTAEYKFIAIKYRSSGATANNIYTKDTGGNPGYSGTAKTWVGPGYTNDNQWHVRILNLDTELSGAKGNITGLRLPIVTAVDGTFDLSYVAAFKTEAEANAYQGPVKPKTENEPNTETGIASILPSLAFTFIASLGITRKRKW